AGGRGSMKATTAQRRRKGFCLTGRRGGGLFKDVVDRARTRPDRARSPLHRARTSRDRVRRFLIGRAAGRRRFDQFLFGLGGSLMSLTGAQRFVSRLTALLAAADSARCPVPPEGTALTRTGRGVWGSRYLPAPPAAQAGTWPPRSKRATRRLGARAGPPYGCERAELGLPPTPPH